jgi:hypothetical protein
MAARLILWWLWHPTYRITTTNPITGFWRSVYSSIGSPIHWSRVLFCVELSGLDLSFVLSAPASLHRVHIQHVSTRYRNHLSYVCLLLLRPRQLAWWRIFQSEPNLSSATPQKHDRKMSSPSRYLVLLFALSYRTSTKVSPDWAILTGSDAWVWRTRKICWVLEIVCSKTFSCGIFIGFYFTVLSILLVLVAKM